MSDLTRHLYNCLQARFGSPGDACGAGAQFLAFERLGMGLTAADFKLQPTDGAFNPAIAAQQGATLVDFIAQIDSDGFLMPRADLSPTVTGQYEQILSTASYGIRPASDAALKSFLQSKARARRIFDQSQVAMNLAQCYWPTSFVPALWFDDRSRTTWLSYSSSTGESAIADWSWRVVTPDAVPNMELVRRLQATPAPLRHSSYIYRSQIADGSPRATGATAHPPQVGRASALSAVATSLRPGLNPIMATSAAFNSLVSTLPAQPTTSKDFKLSFQYCVANISRPWLSGEFLTAANWYVPGLPAGGLARGIYQRGAQRFAFLPTKLVIVKNLTLKAKWSEHDRACARNSASLGPFSLINAQFESDTLTAPGMQIIAWFCQVVQTLPALADPATQLSTH